MIAFILSNLKNVGVYLIGIVGIWAIAILNEKKNRQIDQKQKELDDVKDAIELRKELDATSIGAKREFLRNKFSKRNK